MRIPFIDIAKGISILLVIMIHLGIPEPFPGAYAAKVPIFFLLAGLFFLKSVSRGGYIKKKATSLLVPFAIFYIFSYLIYYLIVFIKSDVIIGDNTFAITDMFTQRQLFNGPLWFLLSLFEVEAAFYLIYVWIKKEWQRAVVVCAIVSIGFLLSVKKMFMPLWIDTSCVALMYFYLGYIISLKDLTTKSISTYWLIVIAVVAYGLYLLMPVTIGMSTNYYSDPYLAVTSGSLIILVILVVSKLLEKMTFLAWLGTNSLVLLCTHHLIYRPIKFIQIKIGMESSFILFMLTIIIDIAVVLIINRHFPVLAGKYGKNRHVYN